MNIQVPYNHFVEYYNKYSDKITLETIFDPNSPPALLLRIMSRNARYNIQARDLYVQAILLLKNTVDFSDLIDLRPRDVCNEPFADEYYEAVDSMDRNDCDSLIEEEEVAPPFSLLEESKPLPAASESKVLFTVETPKPKKKTARKPFVAKRPPAEPTASLF